MKNWEEEYARLNYIIDLLDQEFSGTILTRRPLDIPLWYEILKGDMEDGHEWEERQTHTTSAETHGSLEDDIVVLVRRHLIQQRYLS